MELIQSIVQAVELEVEEEIFFNHLISKYIDDDLQYQNTKHLYEHAKMNQRRVYEFEFIVDLFEGSS